MKKKLMYEVPDVELIELKLEGYLMQSGYSDQGTVPGTGDDDNQGTF